MLYKFCNKKGNITVVLIGLISVMILMTIALSKRMTGHTQLLTLGDYTQISRYFLESYISFVMQQVRKQVNDPNSKLSKKICESIDEAGGEIPLTENVDYDYKEYPDSEINEQAGMPDHAESASLRSSLSSVFFLFFRKKT